MIEWPGTRVDHVASRLVEKIAELWIACDAQAPTKHDSTITVKTFQGLRLLTPCMAKDSKKTVLTTHLGLIHKSK